MRFCTECGTKILSQGKFCGECGTQLAAQPVIEAQPVPIATIDSPSIPVTAIDNQVPAAYNALSERKDAEPKKRRPIVVGAIAAGLIAAAWAGWLFGGNVAESGELDSAAHVATNTPAEAELSAPGTVINEAGDTGVVSGDLIPGEGDLAPGLGETDTAAGTSQAQSLAAESQVTRFEELLDPDLDPIQMYEIFKEICDSLVIQPGISLLTSMYKCTLADEVYLVSTLEYLEGDSEWAASLPECTDEYLAMMQSDAEGTGTCQGNVTSLTYGENGFTGSMLWGPRWNIQHLESQLAPTETSAIRAFLPEQLVTVNFFGYIPEF